MLWFALLIGLLSVLCLHQCLRWLANTQPKHIRRTGMWAFILLGLLIALLLFRYGAHAFAALTGVVSVLTPLLNRLSSLWWIWRLRQRMQASERPLSDGGSAMTKVEACAILGIAEDANAETIEESYRRLMRKLHPDVGGSAYLAQKLNEARNLLLKKP